MRLFCLSISLFLHLVLVGTLVSGLWVDRQDTFTPRELIEMELVQSPSKIPEQPTKPQPEATKPHEQPDQGQEPTTRDQPPDLAPKEQPVEASSPDKKAPPDQPPKAQAGTRPSPPNPDQGLQKDQSDQGNKGVLVQNEYGDRLKHGAEARGLQALAALDFKPQDYAGHYSTTGQRQVTIIDGRKTWGRLILYDSKTGLLRTLTPFAKHIYTYGPSFLEDRPIEGSVTFVPNDDQISRFIWLPKDGSAEFPNRIEPPQASLEIRYGQLSFPAQLFNASKRPQQPLTLVIMRTRDRSMALAHLLASQGLRVCALAEHDWRGSNQDLGSMRQARYILQTIKTLRQELPESRPGLYAWTEPTLLPGLIQAASLSQDFHRLLVQADPEAPCPRDCPSGARLGLPIAWMLPQDSRSNCPQGLIQRLNQKQIRLLAWGDQATAPRRLDEAIAWLTAPKDRVTE